MTFQDTKTKERVARKDGKQLTLPPKPLGKRFYRPTSDTEFRQLAHELLEWAHLPTSVNINDFPISKMISPYRFKRYKLPYFQEALEMANYIIASRNRSLTNAKECDKDIYFKELYLLDKDYKEAEDEKIQRRKESAKAMLTELTLIDEALK